ncbi:MAG: hypothetical protein F4Z52_07190 [Gammaproteobacteria bacterium]|nr:hypothetical protein [Gammaproteobacteria bacterium]
MGLVGNRIQAEGLKELGAAEILNLRVQYFHDVEGRLAPTRDQLGQIRLGAAGDEFDRAALCLEFGHDDVDYVFLPGASPGAHLQRDTIELAGQRCAGGQN